MVKDKINYRARGPIEMLTRQTVGGRANDGGLRIGEMERDGVIAHGASRFLQESMLVRGDEYYMAVCNNSGTLAIYNNSQNLFLSPMADGPIKFNTTIDKNLNIENVSKYGRQFSILRIPYAFKLLIQELQAMNIQMRLITEDNIDQLTSMAYSNNILKLQQDDSLINVDGGLKMAITNEVKNRSNLVREGPRIDMTEPSKLNEPSEQPKEAAVLEPEAYGWAYYSYDEERGEAYKSIILNNKGEATEVWFVGENDGQLPNRHPAGWNAATLLYNDKTPIMPHVMIEELINNQEPNNWSISLDAIRREDKGKLFALGNQLVSNYVQGSPEFAPGSPAYDPNTPPNAYGSPQIAPGSPAYDPNTPQYAPNSPQFAPGSPAYDPNTPQYAPNSPQFAPSSPAYDPNSPQFAPGSPAYVQQEPSRVIVLDSPNPVVIMPNQTSIQSSSSNRSSANQVNPPLQIGDTINIETNDVNEIENIGKMIEKSKPKRDDGIELIINTDSEKDGKSEENKKENKEQEEERKTIKLA